jgi:hypothetical protein
MLKKFFLVRKRQHMVFNHRLKDFFLIKFNIYIITLYRMLVRQLILKDFHLKFNLPHNLIQIV